MTSAPSGPDEYRVAVYSKLDNTQELNGVLQRELKLHPTDALIWARHVPGILNGIFSAEQAHSLAAAINQIGIRSSAIPAVDIPDVHRAENIHHARCNETGLQVVRLREEDSVVIPWSAIELICVGEVPIEVNQRYSTGMWSGVSAGPHYQHPGLTVPGTPTLEVWIVCRPPMPILCIDHGRMNYEYLGTRCVESATVNFHQFMTDLIEHASSATLTESTGAYMSHVHPELYRFPNRNDLMQHVTLQTLMIRRQVNTPTMAGDVKP